MRQAALLFGGVALDKPDYVALWRRLKPDSQVEEVVRNFFIRQPMLWLADVSSRSRLALGPDRAPTVWCLSNWTATSSGGADLHRPPRRRHRSSSHPRSGLSSTATTLAKAWRSAAPQGYAVDERYPWTGVHATAVNRLPRIARDADAESDPEHLDARRPRLRRRRRRSATSCRALSAQRGRRTRRRRSAGRRARSSGRTTSKATTRACTPSRMWPPCRRASGRRRRSRSSCRATPATPRSPSRRWSATAGWRCARTASAATRRAWATRSPCRIPYRAPLQAGRHRSGCRACGDRRHHHVALARGDDRPDARTRSSTPTSSTTSRRRPIPRCFLTGAAPRGSSRAGRSGAFSTAATTRSTDVKAFTRLGQRARLRVPRRRRRCGSGGPTSRCSDVRGLCGASAMSASGCGRTAGRWTTVEEQRGVLRQMPRARRRRRQDRLLRSRSQGDDRSVPVDPARVRRTQHLMVNFHGANKPTGEARTWPQRAHARRRLRPRAPAGRGMGAPQHDAAVHAVPRRRRRLHAGRVRRAPQ